MAWATRRNISPTGYRPEFPAYTQKILQPGKDQSEHLFALTRCARWHPGQVPFFKPIDPTETIIESNATWGRRTGLSEPAEDHRW